MKKQLLTIAFALISLVSLSQTEVRTYMNVSGAWNQYTEAYDYGDKVYANITFTLYPKVILTNDKSNSVYRVMSDQMSDENSKWKAASWECLDEKNRNCVFLVMYHKNANMITVSVNYPSMSFLYYVDAK